MIADSSLNLGDANLLKDALKLYLLLQEVFPWLLLHDEIEYARNYDAANSEPASIKAREKCPVCDEYVNIVENTLFAQCDTGHFWGKKRRGIQLWHVLT